MLHIHASNRLEFLAQCLAARLREEPAPVFEPQVVVTAGPAMARWLHLQLCRHNGVAAHIEYPLPAAWIWSLARRCLEGIPDEDPLSREAMTWKIFGALPALVDGPGFEVLRRYLAGDRDGIRRWQLAGKIADVFDRYQYYRPGLILEWDQAERGQDWQAVLWRAIQPQGGIHRVGIAHRLMALLDADTPAVSLPERMHWFAVQTLPPMLVQVLGALSRHSEIHLWLLSPTEHYWGDLKPEKAVIRKRMENPREAALWETGNLLLASWGRQGQVFQDLLLEQSDSDVIDHHQSPERDTLLHHVQADLFELRGDGRPGAAPLAIEPDDSLQLHVCHTPLRECQVLHDRLLAMMQRDATLKPEDILVLVPEISRYAPFIEAVFQKDARDGSPFLPWNLSDISLADEHPLIRIFLQLLELPESRFTLPEVLGYLDVPEVAGRFGLTSGDGALVREWLAQSRVYWGLDGGHKRELGLPAIEENTWRQACRHLFCGYALGGGGHHGGIVPVAGVEGVNAAVLGRFWQLFETLKSWAGRLKPSRRVDQWQRTLNQLLETFFVSLDDEDGRLQKIRDEVAGLAENAGELAETLSLPLVRHWLSRRLAVGVQGGRAYSGGVAFCGLQPLRGVPFRVICLLGMQDGDFPRRGVPAEFDRMRERRLHGDPHCGDEDRALFLETLLAARDRLYISYTGRGVRDNSALQPSVLVRELLDYLDRHYQCATEDARSQEGDKNSVSQAITTAHALQPFSIRNYSGKGPLSFDAWWLQAARALHRKTTPTAQEPWSTLELPELEPGAREITPGKLAGFLAHPCKGFVHSRLRLYLQEKEWEPDSEPFELDNLEAYQIKDRLIDDWLEGRRTTAETLRAEGRLPHGSPGEKILANQMRSVEELIGTLETLGLQRSPSRFFDVDLRLKDTEGRDWSLQGRVTRLWPDGLIRFRPATLRGKDVLGLWIDHLLWIMAEGREDERCSRHLGADGDFVLKTAFGPDRARAFLSDLLALYWEGLHSPLPLFEGASWAWASSRFGKRNDDEKAMTAARKDWQGDDHRKIPGDRDDPYVQLLLRGTSGEPLTTPGFTELAARLYRSVFEHRERLA